MSKLQKILTPLLLASGLAMAATVFAAESRPEQKEGTQSAERASDAERTPAAEPDVPRR